LLPETTQQFPKKNGGPRPNFVGSGRKLCYSWIVAHEFTGESVQYRISPYKFFRLLEYTASYF